MLEALSEFALYYQATGPSVVDNTPIVLAVGTRDRCEKLRSKLMDDPQFLALLARQRHGSLQIAPSGGRVCPLFSGGRGKRIRVGR